MEDRDNMVPDPPLPRVPDKPMEPPETPLQDLAREVDSLDPMRADRLEGRWLKRVMPLNQPEGSRICGVQTDEASKISIPLPKTFTTQAVPFMVHLALRRAVSDVLDSIPGIVHSHTAVMIHPRDWGWYLEYLRQQGTLDEKTGPIGSLEIEGITVLQDVGGKVPHLELRAE